MTLRFVVFGGLWFDKVNGNSYHVSKILDMQTGEFYYTDYTYGYGHQYWHTAYDFLLLNLDFKDFILYDMGSAFLKKSDLKRKNF